jgi:Uma2 family endonuclease
VLCFAAMHRPAAWVRKDRWDALTREQRAKFAPLCPDFVIELKSPSDTLDALHDTMREWIANGARLGWLVDLDDRRVWIYDGAKDPRVLEGVARVRAESVVPGFELDLAAIG